MTTWKVSDRGAWALLFTEIVQEARAAGRAVPVDSRAAATILVGKGFAEERVRVGPGITVREWRLTDAGRAHADELVVVVVPTGVGA